MVDEGRKSHQLSADATTCNRNFNNKCLSCFGEPTAQKLFDNVTMHQCNDRCRMGDLSEIMSSKKSFGEFQLIRHD
jgi:hypothetical protein